MAVIKLLDSVERLNDISDDANKLNEECDIIAKDIASKKIKLFQIIEKLENLLTNQDINLRQNGLNVLSSILAKIDKTFLNEQETKVLTSFYSIRLKDHHSLIPNVILGYLSIIQMTALSMESVIQIFHSLFNEVRCQSELQEIRHNIYLIIKIGLTNHSSSLKLMGPDFVYGVISSMDGESDPRNLMLLFEFLPQFISEFSLGHLTEEMFQVLACYFPVDFNSAGLENKEITRERLAQGLEKCLISAAAFGEFCLPLIVEKLDSEIKKAKLDSLNLLIRGSLVYGAKILQQHMDEIWPLLRRDLLTGNDQEIKSKAHEAVDQIILTIGDDITILEEYIKRIFIDLKSSLTDVQLSLYWPSIKVLETMAKAHKNACAHVLKITIPLCLGQYTTSISDSVKIHIITSFNNFLDVALSFELQIQDIPELSWTDLPSLYLNELNTSNPILKSKIIEGLSIQKLSLTPSQRELIYNKLSEIIDSDTDDIVINSCYKFLIATAKDYTDEILQLIDHKLKIDTTDEKKIQKNRLKTLAAISKLSNIGPKILMIFNEIVTSDDAEMRLFSLNCIQTMLQSENFEYDVHEYLFKNCRILSRILDHERININKHAEEISVISQILKLILRKLNAEEQKMVVDDHLKNFQDKMEENIQLIEGLITPLMSCNIYHYFDFLIERLLYITINGTHENNRLISCKLSASLINKMTNDQLERVLNIIREMVVDILENSDDDMEKKKAAVMLNIWCTKALITKGHIKSQEFLDYQLNILKNEIIGEFAGTQIKTFVDDSDSTLIAENYCIIKMFYKQRIFQNIINQNELFNNIARQNYLTAFVYLAEAMSQEILLMHLFKIVPLLIESLSLDNRQLILSTLKILQLLLKTKHTIFIDLIQNFIPTCLKLTTHSNMNVRIAAHDCLYSYCEYPTVFIKPYKDDILEKLSETIDDKKRLVRKSAVMTRTRWFLVGSPGEPE
ncbi:MMS19 nucleotide excision repair protein homolog [Chelonus insularis]|uniref:MMS19 nucleotide excision repair protein homolog n=1 Tax=Chelonus insularis TaxID=460826 RepID=UPI0015891AA1|nr:MMS19 nucleotide excision repair protein homolog [Chelonus insularis]